MKRLLTLIAFTLIGLTVNAQGLKTRSDGTFTQFDQRFAAGLNLSIPSGAIPTLNGGLPRPGSLFYSTLDKKTYSFDGVSTWTIIGGSSYTFSNGLTNTGNSVTLGGNVSSPVSLNMDLLGGATFNVGDFESGNKYTGFTIGSGGTFIGGVDSPTNQGSEGLFYESALSLRFRNSIGTTGFDISPSSNGIEITDDIHHKGLSYTNYYADFNTANPLHIPPKRYIDSLITNVNSNVVHKTGNEVIMGMKTIKDNNLIFTRPTDGAIYGLLSREQSTNSFNITAGGSPGVSDLVLGVSTRNGLVVNKADGTLRVISDHPTGSSTDFILMRSSNVSATNGQVSQVPYTTFVDKVSNETIGGTKTFTSNPKVPTTLFTGASASLAAIRSDGVLAKISDADAAILLTPSFVRKSGDETIIGTKTFRQDTAYIGVSKTAILLENGSIPGGGGSSKDFSSPSINYKSQTKSGAGPIIPGEIRTRSNVYYGGRVNYLVEANYNNTGWNGIFGVGNSGTMSLYKPGGFSASLSLDSLTDNRNSIYLPNNNGILALKSDIPKTFTYTASGDATTAIFSVAHGLTSPTMVIVTANTEDAMGKDINSDDDGTNFYAVINGANIDIKYRGGRPPIAGTNNLKWSIMVK